jgi:hypothetical protein
MENDLVAHDVLIDGVPYRIEIYSREPGDFAMRWRCLRCDLFIATKGNWGSRENAVSAAFQQAYYHHISAHSVDPR